MEQTWQELMDKLKIDPGLREIISRLWEHGYETFDSCEGHGRHPAYLVLNKGDGWFEQNAGHFGLEKHINQPDCPCCNGTPSHLEWPANKVCCKICGAGVNCFVVYRGIDYGVSLF